MVHNQSVRKKDTEIKSYNNAQIFFSDWENLKHGKPEGSILWPLLPTVYINGLDTRIIIPYENQ